MKKIYNSKWFTTLFYMWYEFKDNKLITLTHGRKFI